MGAPRLTEHTAQLLRTLAAHPDTEFHSLDLAERTGVLPGTSYPILLRLHQSGWISARWDSGPRRLYRLTPAGLRAAVSALARYQTRPVGMAQARGWCPA